jgi:ubiquitin carboxyl-terminal hydrolase 7
LNESFGTPELLSESEGNGWRPEKGAEKVDAHKGSSLIAQGLPPILQFHLKRFTYDGLTDGMNKVNDRLAFPSELDLSSICKSAETGGSGASIYDLQSVVVHAGKYGMGHYYSYVRPDPKSDVWYRFNDDMVEEVTEKDVFEDAYGGRNKISTRSRAAQDKREFPVLGRLLRRLGGNGGYSYGFGGSESNAYVVQYVRRCDLGKLYLQ